MIDFSSIKIFNDNIATLKETSKDNHDGNYKYMTESTLNVVDFDAVKREYIKALHVDLVPASNDALYMDNNGECYFIEFKNGYINTKMEYDLWLKIYDSLLIFIDILDSNTTYTRSSMSYILVYNEGKTPLPDGVNSGIQVSPTRDEIGKTVMKKGKNRLIRFNLERFQKLYFSNVYTYTEMEFETEFVSKHSI